ncbi:hypothetical protein Aperf_G00000064371 [Anoplocephala perfoliata]
MIACMLLLSTAPSRSDTYEHEEIWRSSFLEAISCEPIPEIGEWCEWSEWSSCDYRTCTRKRRRLCACPKPADFRKNACPAVLPQDDIRVGNSIKLHTRFVRRSHDGVCKIPFFHGNRYYGDCEKMYVWFKLSDFYIDATSGGAEKCAVGSEGKLSPCLPQKDEMVERDIGPCEGWRLAQGWAQSKISEKSQTIIGSASPLGRQCYNPKIYSHGAGSLEQCVEKYHFSKAGQRNTYSNLNNLAFNVENCIFACAIDHKCQAVEFSEGYFCKLYSEYNSEGLKREVGTTLFTKPSDCIFHLDKKQEAQYPFRDAVKDIHTVQ